MSNKLFLHIPQNWTITKLENLVTKFVGGGTPSRRNSAYYQGNIPWMTVKDMTSHRPQKVTEYITLEAVTNSATNLIPPDTIIIATRMSLGKVVRVPFEVAINQDLKALILPNDIEKDFLEYWYISEASNIQSLGTGTTVKGIRLEVLQQLKIPLPPLNEQKRIVAKIEALQKRSQRVKEAIDAIPQLLDQFRQSVLAAAFRGDLTADWRRHDEEELLDYNFPSTWKKGKLSDVVEGLKQGWSPKCKNFPSSSDDIWGVIKTSAVQSLRFIEGENKQLPSHLKPRPDLELHEGDLLITRAGPRARAGITCLVSSVRPKLIVCDKVYRFRAKESYVLPLYLAYFLNSPSTISLIDKLKTGISDSGVNLTQDKFLALPLWFPPITEQQEIIRQIQSFFKAADIIEQQYQETKTNLDLLNQSILMKAFRGELVPQNPNDEPASILLERIRAEREKLQQQTKAAKKSKSKTTKRRSKKAPQKSEESVQMELDLE